MLRKSDIKNHPIEQPHPLVTSCLTLSKNQPWLNNEIIDYFKKKNLLYRKKKLQNSPQNSKFYYEAKQQVKNKVRQSLEK